MVIPITYRIFEMSDYYARPVHFYEWPTNWNEVFLRDGPNYIEIGFGNGRFLVDMAKSAPQANLIGIEISMPSIKNCERKIEKAQLENVSLVRGKAQSAIWLLFQRKSISKVFINFPDPWPKPAHNHRRLIRDGFIDLLATRMVVGAGLHIATDHQDYAEWIEDVLSRSNYFNFDLVMQDGADSKERKSTKYEFKAIREGRPCYYFNSVRNSITDDHKYLIPQELPMPHAVLQSPAGLKLISDRFEPMRFFREDISVRFIECYFATEGDRLVIDTFVNETPLEQRIFLSLARRKHGDLLLSVHEVGFPRSTRGVHEAVHWFAEWVISLDEKNLLLRENLVVS